MDRLYILCLVILLGSFTAFAEDIQVVFSKGQNYKIPLKGEKVLLRKGLTVIETDRVKVSSTGLVILKIKGHSVMKLESGTEVVVNKLPYFYEGTSEIEQPSDIELKFGTTLIKMINETKSESLIIRSKSAAMGVRGTKFLVSNEDDLLVSVNEGLVEIKNTVNGQNDFIGKSESIVMEKGLAFTARTHYESLKEINWDVEDKNSSKWRRVKSKLRAEFKQKRKPWKSDNTRLKKLKSQWKRKKDDFKVKARSFKRSKKLENRKIQIQKYKQKRKTLPSLNQIQNGEPASIDRSKIESLRRKVRERTKLKPADVIRQKERRKKRRRSAERPKPGVKKH